MEAGRQDSLAHGMEMGKGGLGTPESPGPSHGPSMARRLGVGQGGGWAEAVWATHHHERFPPPPALTRADRETGRRSQGRMVRPEKERQRHEQDIHHHQQAWHDPVREDDEQARGRQAEP